MVAAKVLHPLKLNGEQVSPGSVIELEATPFANLQRKGWVAPADSDTEPDQPSADSRKPSPKLRTR